MSLLEWKDHYSIGIASMDDEHKEMIDLINTVYDKLNRDPDEAQIEECLGDIFSAISMHFALEENIMRRRHYPEFRAHKNDHEDLLDQLRDLMDAYVDDPVTGARKLEQGLSSWFEDHFSTFDARLHELLGPHEHDDHSTPTERARR